MGPRASTFLRLTLLSITPLLQSAPLHAATGDDDQPGSHVETPGTATRVAVAGTWAYVADKTAGLQIIDLADPSGPRLVGGVQTGEANAVEVAGRYAFVADGVSGITVVDIANPAAPVVVATPNPCASYGIAVDGRFAHLAVYGGLQVFDVANPLAPAYVGDVDWASRTYAVVTAGQYAYYADSRRGVRIFDIADATHPVLVREVDTPGEPRDLALAGGYLFVADGAAGLQVLDVAAPLQAKLVGAATSPGFANGVTVSGSRAYVADGPGGLQVYDVTNPLRPLPVEQLATTGDAAGVTVHGVDLLVAAGGSGLLIFARQAQANRVPLCEPGGPYFGTMGQVIAFDARRSKDMDGVLGEFIWSFGDGATAMGATVAHAYASAGTFPVRLCLVDDDGGRSCCETTVDLQPTAVTLALDVAYVDGAVHLEWRTPDAARVTGFDVDRRESDREPFLRLNPARLPATGTGRDFEFTDAAIEPGHTYTYRLSAYESDGSVTVAARDVAVPLAVFGPASVGFWAPNPFPRRAQFAVALPRNAAVHLAIYDAAGRRIRILAHENLARGTHVMAWGGDDDRGRAVQNGVYAVRLQAGAQTVTRKVVVVD